MLLLPLLLLLQSVIVLVLQGALVTELAVDGVQVGQVVVGHQLLALPGFEVTKSRTFSYGKVKCDGILTSVIIPAVVEDVW